MALWARIEKKHRINSYLVIHCPASEGVSKVSEQTSECSRVRERSEWCGASKWVSGASERANGRASGPALQSGYLVSLTHSAVGLGCNSPTAQKATWVRVSIFSIHTLTAFSYREAEKRPRSVCFLSLPLLTRLVSFFWSLPVYRSSSLFLFLSALRKTVLKARKSAVKPRC